MNREVQIAAVLGLAAAGVYLVWARDTSPEYASDMAPKEDSPETETLGIFGAYGDFGPSIFRGVNTVVASIYGTVRGMRNNNPGNIRLGGPWQGMAESQTDGSFVQFVSMEYGIRALAKLLLTYHSRYNLRTATEIISRWAPPNENDTGAYIRTVANAAGAGPGDALNFSEGDDLFQVTRAIIAHENGRVPALLISDDTVRAGIALAYST